MKKFHLYITAGIIATFMFAGCESPDYVNPTANRSGITSLTAYFTSGPNTGKEAIKYDISNSASMTDYVIPVPWYYPDESDNTTEQYMSSMKVVAVLENNCLIDPPITVLDLTKKNQFTYTDPDGSQKKITISGQMTKSDKCAIKAFILEPGDVSGVIDEDKKTISLITAGDLSECTANVTLSPHATISPNPADVHNYNNGMLFTVTADNGTSKAVYTVKQQIPPKISAGIRKGSQVNLFSKTLSDYGISSVDHPTLASVGNYVIIDPGDGSVPSYVSKITGLLGGKIAMGDADASGCVASDLNGNMLISNYAQSGSTLKIYKTNSVTTAPALYITYANALGLPLGSRIHIQGSLDGDAVITATCDGPYSQHFLRWIVKDGVLVNSEPTLVKVGVAEQWGGTQSNSKVVACSTKVEDGYFLSYYSKNYVYHCDGTTNAPTSYLAPNDATGGNYNYNSLDTREFNNMKYLALLTVSYFTWSNASLYLYDVSSFSNFSGTIDASKALIYEKDNLGASTENYNAAGDVLMIPSKDGYKLDIYYVDNNMVTLGGVEFDCIDK